MGDEDKKRATVAGNAKQIAGLRDQLDGIHNMLQALAQEKKSPRRDKQAMGTPYTGFHEEEMYDYSDAGWDRPVYGGASPYRQGMYRRDEGRADTGRRLIRGRRETPESMGDVMDNDEIQRRVSNLLSATLNPVEPKDKGKKHFAHTHVVRGKKKHRTGLRELSLPEYNYGMYQVIKLHDGQTRQAILRHLEALNEDASMYEWAEVRAWSEEVATRISEQRLEWGEETKIEHLRLKMSQTIRLGASTGGMTDNDSDTGTFSMAHEVQAVKPGPPCRQYNFNACNSPTDHVVNGYRHLHICGFCIYSKCTFNRHPEKDCMGKRIKNQKKKNSTQGNEGRSGGY